MAGWRKQSYVKQDFGEVARGVKGREGKKGFEWICYQLSDNMQFYYRIHHTVNHMATPAPFAPLNAGPNPTPIPTTLPATMPVHNPARRTPQRGRVGMVVEALTQQIRSQQIKEGDKLPTETAIMAHYAVSRTVVREALSRLQAAALVQTHHGIGTFVLETNAVKPFSLASTDIATLDDVIAVLELRISLESEAAGLAAQRRQPVHLQNMEAALTQFEVSITQNNDAVPSDFAFHMEVARATGNRHFAGLLASLGTMIIPRSRTKILQNANEPQQTYLRRVHMEHESIYNAIYNQEPEAARAAMRTHLSNSRDRQRRPPGRMG